MLRILILCTLFTNLTFGQTEPKITYYKDKYRSKEVNNGPYMLSIKKINDSVTSRVFSKTKNGKKIWAQSYLREQPYGIWKYYDKKGNIESTRDYDFILKYGEYIPENAIRFSDLGLFVQTDANSQKIQKHISKQFRYPEIDVEKRIQGKVTFQFTVDENGNVGNLRILEGVNISLDTECFRIMHSLKKLEPYVKDGKKILVYFSFPITFKLA
ncbi:energy transducer TonB [uncultured Maribacter sp.]|uniref:energy transducer TonB n=1 Tax=uncultured Maribacter sp. TaxID=431308 RepID=UPI00260C6474|nr:energy transducer TonB [uncultured Maribacter sp.]